jgi:ParB/RepB/Spo0J family partition protein
MSMKEAMSSDTLKLPLDLIEPNPNQPRKVFNEEKLKGLAQSIKAVGVIQPIVVEMNGEGGRYIIHDGERRWRATKLAGLKEIPVVISAKKNGADVVSDEERLSRALVANIQREDLNLIEVAQGYQDLHDLGWSDKRIAEVAGCSRSKVANARRLLKLPDEIRQPVAEGKISERQAQALLPVYQLPDAVLIKARKGESWQETPEKLINAAIAGRSSTELRDKVSLMVRRATTDISDLAFLNHVFEGAEDIQSAACHTCPSVMLFGKKHRCADFDCLDQKKNYWIALRLAEATEASGLDTLPANIEDMWKQVETFGGWVEVARAMISALSDSGGCVHRNLRLRYEPRFDHYPSVDGYSDVKIVCYHGEGHRCKCLLAATQEHNKNNPDRQDEKEYKKRLENEIVAPAAQVLAEALAESSPDAWRLLLPRMCHVYLDKIKDWSLEKIQMSIARTLISDSVPWNGHADLEQTRRRVQDRLAQAGLSLSDNAPLARLERKIARVLAFVETISEETTQEKIEGNFRNLNDLVEALDEIEAETEQQEQTIRSLIRRIADGLDTLIQAREEREDKRFMRRFR